MMPKDSSLELVIFFWLTKSHKKCLHQTRGGGDESYSKLSKSHPVGFVDCCKSDILIPLLVSESYFNFCFKFLHQLDS